VRERYEGTGMRGLVTNGSTPSIRRAPPGELSRFSGCPGGYAGFNCAAFSRDVQRAHAVTLSYSLEASAPAGGLVKKQRVRGRHRRRRDRGVLRRVVAYRWQPALVRVGAYGSARRCWRFRTTRRRVLYAQLWTGEPRSRS